MNFTDEQIAIFEAFRSHQGHIQIRAGAGCGKTSTSVVGTGYAPEPSILACAFNKRIQLTLEEKMPPKAECRTFNSLGHAAWCEKIGKRVKLDADKMYSVIRSLNLDLESDQFSDALRLAKHGRNNGLVPRGTAFPHISFAPDDFDWWENGCEDLDIDPHPAIISAARNAIAASIRQAHAGLIDFDDQIYMSVCFGAPFKRYPLVLVDEAQDLNPLKHSMITKFLAKDGRLVVVGDPNQSIYGFAGAMSDGMDHLGDKYEMLRLPLMESFRCPQLVIKEAQHDVPEIRAWTEAPLGAVAHLDKWSISSLPFPLTVVCRNNAPLFDLAFRLIREGRGCTILGSDIGKGIEKLIKKITPEGDLPIGEFIPRLERWKVTEIARKPRREAQIMDRYETLMALADNVARVSEALDACKRLFSDEARRGTVLSTIHKAKGLEWKNILFLDPWRIPSKYATEGEALRQEYNCRYVGVTRAQETLTYASLDQQEISQ